VFSFRETVLGIEKSVVAGELRNGRQWSHRTGAGDGRLKKNAFSAIYKIATDFVLLIKYSF
jgi:hypothetical protein